MLKLVQNTLGGYKVLLDKENYHGEWWYIELLHSLQRKEDLDLGNKLTKDQWWSYMEPIEAMPTLKNSVE